MLIYGGGCEDLHLRTNWLDIGIAVASCAVEVEAVMMNGVSGWWLVMSLILLCSTHL